jgi:ABC-type phosphate transport system substrate-binding protein
MALLSLALNLVPATRLARAEEGAAFVVVVNASNEVSEMSPDLVARVFLRKTRAWHGGRPAAPVDLSLASPLRLAFSRKLLSLSAADVRDYWMKQTLSGGDTAPPVRASERDVLDFIKGEPGGIGYVSAGSVLPAEVKVVKVTQ